MIDYSEIRQNEARQVSHARFLSVDTGKEDGSGRAFCHALVETDEEIIV